jgi:hypothetical protein
VKIKIKIIDEGEDMDQDSPGLHGIAFARKGTKDIDVWCKEWFLKRSFVFPQESNY